MKKAAPAPQAKPAPQAQAAKPPEKRLSRLEQLRQGRQQAAGAK